MTRVRVATWNVLHGLDLRTGRVDLSAAAAHLRALDADVVALQEVDRDLPRSGSSHQVMVLAEALGLHGAFAPALLGNPDDTWRAVGEADPGGPAYGVGLISRWPLAEVTRTVLPGGGDGRRSRASPSPGWDREPRAALTAVLATPSGPLRVTSTHLSYLPWRGLAQLRRAATIARGGDPRAACVLAGDLNLPAGAVRAALPAWSHARAEEPTYPVGNPRMQVDQVLVRGPTAIRATHVGSPGTSDHHPLVVDLEVPG